MIEFNKTDYSKSLKNYEARNLIPIMEGQNWVSTVAPRLTGWMKKI